MNPQLHTDVKAAAAAVAAFDRRAADFVLPIAGSLLDPAGFHMAVITGTVLRRGWEPDGYTQEEGYRRYRYKESA